MIRYTRTAAIAPGKLEGAMAFAKEVAAHWKSKYGVTMEVGLPIGGNPYRMCWTATYDNLAAADAVQLKSMADAHFVELLTKVAPEHFVGGSVRDEFWRVVL